MRCSILSTALVFLSGVMAPVTALAGEHIKLADVEYQNWSQQKAGDSLPVGGPVIHVFSEGGDQFDFVGHSNQPIRFMGTITGSCSGIRKISYLHLEVAGVTDSVSHPDGRGAWINRMGMVEVPHQELQAFDAVRACNDKLKTLAAESGRSRGSLVAGGFGVHYPNVIEARATLRCGGRNNYDSDNEMLDLWVECVGNPEADEPQLPTMKAIPATLSPLIADLSYEVDRPNYVGRCPMGLLFTGSITTSRKGTVKYRSIGHDGSTSPTYTLSFKSAGTKAIGKWGETLSQPVASGMLTAAPNVEGGPDYKGWRRLEIVEPKGIGPSPPAEYSVTCQSQSMGLQGAPTEPTAGPNRIRE